MGEITEKKCKRSNYTQERFCNSGEGTQEVNKTHGRKTEGQVGETVWRGLWEGAVSAVSDPAESRIPGSGDYKLTGRGQIQAGLQRQWCGSQWRGLADRALEEGRTLGVSQGK
jgi:hypothetical protein